MKAEEISASIDTVEAPPSKPKPKAKPKPKTTLKTYDPTTFLPRVSSPWKVGAHVSAAGGVENAVVNAAMIGCVHPLCLSEWVCGLG